MCEWQQWQSKNTVYDAHELCQTIWRALKAVFWGLWLNRRSDTYISQSSDFVPTERQNDIQNDCFTLLCMHTQDNNTMHHAIQYARITDCSIRAY